MLKDRQLVIIKWNKIAGDKSVVTYTVGWVRSFNNNYWDAQILLASTDEAMLLAKRKRDELRRKANETLTLVISIGANGDILVNRIPKQQITEIIEIQDAKYYPA